MSQNAMTLHQHAPRPHIVQHAGEAHQAEQASGSAWKRGNERIAVWLTAYVGTMTTAYGFSALAICGLLGVLAILNPQVYTFIAWLSQTFIQLVLLPVIMVGQNVQGRKTDHQNNEMYKFVQNTFHDAEQEMQHLDQQDVHILAIEQTHGEKLDRILALLTAPPNPAWWRRLAGKKGA